MIFKDQNSAHLFSSKVPYSIPSNLHAFLQLAQAFLQLVLDFAINGWIFLSKTYIFHRNF
jgi:hypothetical protein